MKAIVFDRYGPPDVLHIREIEKPVPGDDEVLIKVHAASVNSWDYDLVMGRPFVNRLIFGLLKPKRVNIPGCDIAGHIEASGENVKKFMPGDEVFGDLNAHGWGGFAEYVCAPEKALTLKPAGMTFEQAAAIPQAGVMALQGIRDYKQIQPGQKVLMNGAGGGVGTFAIQLAKSFGAEVTAVDSREKFEMLRSLGADHVIDYTKEDFTRTGHRYDLILDVAARHSVFDHKRALNPNGVYAMVGGSSAAIIQTMLLGPIVSLLGNKKVGILIHKPNKDLAYFTELFSKGKVVPVIDKCYSLGEVPEALRHIGEGHVKGKIIIIL